MLPPTPAPGYGATFGPDAKQNTPVTTENEPATAALILIVAQLLGSLGIVALAFVLRSQIMQYLRLLGILSLLWFLMAAAAFMLAIVGVVIAVRRPTHKRETVFALVLTSIAMVWIVLRTIVSAPSH